MMVMTRDEVFNRIANRIGKQPISCNCEGDDVRNVIMDHLI